METVLDVVFVTSLDSVSYSVQVYDANTGTNLKSYRGVTASSATLAPVGPSDYLLCAQKDRPLLQAWPLNRHDPVQIRFVVPGKVTAMDVSPVGPRYCIIGISEKLYVYNLSSGCLCSVISRHYQPVTSVKFTSCGNFFASGGEDGFVYVWGIESIVDSVHKNDASQLQPHYNLSQHSDKVTDLTLTALGMRGSLISVSLDHTAKVHSLVTGQLQYTVVAPCELMSVTTNSLGSQVFVGGKDGKVWLVSLLPHPPLGNIEVQDSGCDCHEKSVQCMGVTASGNLLITGGAEGCVKVWSLTASARVCLEDYPKSDSVVGERHSTTSSQVLALKRTLHIGKGSITNILIMRIGREVFNAVELLTQEVMTPFSRDTCSDPRAVSIIAPVKGLGSSERDLIWNFSGSEIPSSLLDLIEAKTLSKYSSEGDNSSQSSSDVDISSEIPVELEGRHSGEIESLHEQVEELKKANAELFKFALSQIKHS